MADSASSADVLAHFAKVKQALDQGQSQVEGLLHFFKERITFEESSSKTLGKLSKITMSVDERATEATMFEAIAHLRGDIMNESVQHSEFASSVSRDVLEPLVRLKEGGETVMKLATQVKTATKDLKNAHERCRKGYTKYIQLHGKAQVACSAAGIAGPDLWVPSGDAVTSPTLSMYPTAPSTPLMSGGLGPGPASPARHLGPAAHTRQPSSGAGSAHGSASLPPRRPSAAPASVTSGTGTGYETPSAARIGIALDPPRTPTLTSPPAVAAGQGSTPFDAVSTPILSSVTMGSAVADLTPRLDSNNAAAEAAEAGQGGDGGPGPMLKLDLGARATGAAVDGQTGAAELTNNPFDDSFTSVDMDVGTSHVAELAAPVLDTTAAGTAAVGEAVASDTVAQPVIATPSSVEPSPASSTPLAGFAGVARSSSATSGTSAVGSNTPADGISHSQSMSLPVHHTSSVSGNLDSAVSSLSPSGSGLDNGPDVTSYTSRALKSVASGMFNGLSAILPHVPPAGNPNAPNLVVGTANMSTAERIELQRAAAVAALQAVDEACSECKEAWSAHAKAREKFNSQVASALVIFREIEKKRVAEISDCLRRYTVFVSSLHANLQYDVQRLSGVVEAMGEAPATTQAAMQAFSAPVPTDDRIDFARIDNSMIQSIASQASASGGSSASASVGVGGGAGATGHTGNGNGGSNSRRNSASGVDSGPGVVRRTSFVSTSSDVTGVFSPAMDGSGLIRATSKIFTGLMPGFMAGASLASAAGHEGGHGLEEGGPDAISPSSSAGTPAATASVPPPVPKPAGPPPATAHAAIASETHPAIALTVTYADPPTPDMTVPRNSASGLPSSSGPLSSTSASSSSGSGSGAMASVGRFFGMKIGGGVGKDVAAAGIAAAGIKRPLQSSPLAPKGASMANAPAGLPTGRRASLQHSPSGAPRPEDQSPAGMAVSPSSAAGKVSKGVSVSVSVTGSVRHPNAHGTSGMGVRETAALLEQLHLTPGPVEHLIEALFDPSGAKVGLAADGTLVLLAEEPGDEGSAALAAGSSESEEQEAVPQISLADFASGRSSLQPASGHTSPVDGRSRGGTGASGSFAHLPGGDGGWTRPGSPAGDGRPRAVSVIPLNEASFGALAAGGIHSSPGHDNGAAAQPSGTGSRRGSLATSAALSSGAQHAQLNPAVIVLLPKVCDGLRTSADALARLVMALDARRSEGAALSRPSFDALSAVLMAALDGASSRSDFARARSLMVISQTFFCYVKGDEDPDVVYGPVANALQGAGLQGLIPAGAVVANSYAFSGPVDATTASARPKRYYVQSRVRGHALWQSVAYWESAVYDAIGVELAKAGLAAPAGHANNHGPMAALAAAAGGGGGGVNLGFGIRVGGKDKASKAEAEEAAREAEVAFGQLGFFGYTMIAFNVPEDNVKKLLDKYTRALGLQEAKAMQLSGSVRAFAHNARQEAESQADKRTALRAAAKGGQ